MSHRISESKDTSGVVDTRSEELVENVRQFLKRCRKVPVVSGLECVCVSVMLVGKAVNRL